MFPTVRKKKHYKTGCLLHDLKEVAEAICTTCLKICQLIQQKRDDGNHIKHRLKPHSYEKSTPLYFNATDRPILLKHL